MSVVSVYSYTTSITYVSDNILKSLKDIIRLSGLNPQRFVGNWELNMRALKTWLEAQTLIRLALEIYKPTSGDLITRWDLDIVYGWSDSPGTFWTDTEQLKYAIKKAGVMPSDADYDVLMENKPGRPDVAGWGPRPYRSTTGMVRQSLGTTVEHSGLGASASFLRKA